MEKDQLCPFNVVIGIPVYMALVLRFIPAS